MIFAHFSRLLFPSSFFKGPKQKQTMAAIQAWPGVFAISNESDWCFFNTPLLALLSGPPIWHFVANSPDVVCRSIVELAQSIVVSPQSRAAETAIRTRVCVGQYAPLPQGQHAVEDGFSALLSYLRGAGCTFLLSVESGVACAACGLVVRVASVASSVVESQIPAEGDVPNMQGRLATSAGFHANDECQQCLTRSATPPAHRLLIGDTLVVGMSRASGSAASRVTRDADIEMTRFLFSVKLAVASCRLFAASRSMLLLPLLLRCLQIICCRYPLFFFFLRSLQRRDANHIGGASEGHFLA